LFFLLINHSFQATELQSTLDAAKMPAARTLQAANAYEMIVKAVANSTEAADQAKDAAENAASMVTFHKLKKLMIYRKMSL
jgi:uncharacterized protein with PhoU and TrkA domain